MRFCTNCGSQIDDQATFCTNCGAAAPVSEPQAPAYQQPVYQQPVYQQPAYQPPVGTSVPSHGEPKKTNPKKIILPVGIAAAVIAVIVAIVLIVSGGYKRPISDQMDMTVGKASKAQIKRMYPAEVWEFYEENFDMTFEDQYEEYEDGIDDIVDALEDEYGKNVRISYKVKDKDEWDEDDLDDLRERLNDRYDIKESSVKKAYEVEIEMTIKGSEDDDEEEATLDVVKIGSSWYILRF